MRIPFLNNTTDSAQHKSITTYHSTPSHLDYRGAHKCTLHHRTSNPRFTIPPSSCNGEWIIIADITLGVRQLSLHLSIQRTGSQIQIRFFCVCVCVSETERDRREVRNRQMSGQTQTSQLKSLRPTHNTYLPHIWSWNNHTRWPSNFRMLKYNHTADDQQWTALYIRMKTLLHPYLTHAFCDVLHIQLPVTFIHSLRTIAKLIPLNKNHTFLSSFFVPHSEPFLPTQCRCKGLMFHLITPQWHTNIHSVVFLWTGIGPSQRPLPENTHNTHKRQASMPPAGFEPTIPASQRPPVIHF